MKMAMQYWVNRGVRPAAGKFIFFRGGYHGDTTGAMAISDPASGMQAPFTIFDAALLSSICRRARKAAPVRAPARAPRRGIAGIIVEPLAQGAGGMRFHDPTVLARLRAAADRYELLLIFDEIFTGFGRTGEMFACAAAGVVPGHRHIVEGADRRELPLAATVTPRKVFDAFQSDDPATP